MVAIWFEIFVICPNLYGIYYLTKNLIENFEIPSAKTTDGYVSNNIFFEILKCVDGANQKEDLSNW